MAAHCRVYRRRYVKVVRSGAWRSSSTMLEQQWRSLSGFRTSGFRNTFKSATLRGETKCTSTLLICALQTLNAEARLFWESHNAGCTQPRTHVGQCFKTRCNLEVIFNSTYVKNEKKFVIFLVQKLETFLPYLYNCEKKL